MSARLDLEELYIRYNATEGEYIYGKHVEGSEYIIAAVPFLSSMFAFCDIVRVRLVNNTLVVDPDGLLQPSSFRTIRMRPARPEDPAFRDLVAQLDRSQCAIGWQTERNTTSIAVPINILSEISAMLAAAEERGIITLIDSPLKPLQATA